MEYADMVLVDARTCETCKVTQGWTWKTIRLLPPGDADLVGRVLSRGGTLGTRPPILEFADVLNEVRHDPHVKDGCTIYVRYGGVPNTDKLHRSVQALMRRGF